MKRRSVFPAAMTRHLAFLLLLAVLTGAVFVSACNNASEQIQGSGGPAVSEETPKEPLIYKNVPAEQMLCIVPYEPEDGHFPDGNMWDVVGPIMARYPKRHNKNSPDPSSTDTGYSLGFGSTSGSNLIFSGNPKRKTPQPSSFLPYFSRLSEC